MISRRDLLKAFGIATTSYFIYGSGLWKPNPALVVTVDLELDLEVFGNIIKEIYIPPIRELVNKKSILLKRLSMPASDFQWNDDYRDTVRRFWRREPGHLPTFARRLHGSSDIFERSGRRPSASINYITSHDGYTLRDLVSYQHRHNSANGESNNDGHRENLSENFGAEGPTDDAAIETARRRQQRNLFATLLVSQGVPMILAGDELGRSQQGNNNAYCQDNELNWIDWQAADERGSDLNAFVTLLLKVRREHPVLSHPTYIHSPHQPDSASIQWLNSDGQEMREEHWQEHLPPLVY